MESSNIQSEEYCPPEESKKGIQVSSFLQLFVSFLCVVVFTAIAVFLNPDYDFLYAIRIFMGVFFLVVSTFKIAKYDEFIKAYQQYDLIAMRSRVYARIYPFIELILGIAYFAAYDITIINWITLVLMLIGAFGVLRLMMKKSNVCCACFGIVLDVPVQWITLFENILLAAIAASMLFYL